MVKSYFFIALGLLGWSNQVNAMGSWRGVCVPAAGLVASAWCLKTPCQAQVAPKLALSRSHFINGDEAEVIFKRCNFLPDVCRDEHGGFSKCSFSLSQSGQFGVKPAFLDSSEFKQNEHLFVERASCIMTNLFGEEDGAVIVKNLPLIIKFYRFKEAVATAGRYLTSWIW